MSRIVVVGNLADSLVRFRGRLLADMVVAGHVVYACAPPEDVGVAEALGAMGVAFVPVRMARTGVNPFADVALCWRLFCLFRRLHPDVVLCYTAKPAIYGTLAAFAARVSRRYVLITGLGYAFTSGGGLFRRLLCILVRRLYQLALVCCQRVIFQNPDDCALFLQEALVSSSEKCAVVNGSGVDLEHYSFLQMPKAGQFTFLMIARLLRDKGVVEYAEAARRLRQRHPAVRVLLVGPMDPNPSAISEEIVQGWMHEGVLEYLGVAHDVRPLLAACTVFVLPSYREGTPRTVLEAMATGRPVITTDAPGCRETVERGVNGYLVPVGDSKMLAQAMEYCVTHPEEMSRLGARGRQIAESRYEVGAVSRTMMSWMDLC